MICAICFRGFSEDCTALERVLDLAAHVRVARAAPGGSDCPRNEISPIYDDLEPCDAGAAKSCLPEPDSPTRARHSRGRTTRSMSCKPDRFRTDASRRDRDESVLDLDLGSRRRHHASGCGVGRPPACRRQRTSCSADTDSSGGSASVHASWTYEQRGRRSSPSACRPGRGAVPGLPMSWCSPTSRELPLRATRVYGCAACRKSAPFGPSSASRPAYMTATRSTAWRPRRGRG